MRIMFLLAATSTFLAISGTAAATSFDCSKTKAAADQTICTNPGLSQADDALAALFAKAKAAATDKRAFREEQRQAWNWRQKNCVDPACLKRWYSERTTALDHVVATGEQAGFQAPLVSGIPATASGAQRSSGPKAVAPPPKPTPHYVQPTDLIAAYRGNSIAADRKYAGKQFPMRGRVMRVGIDNDRKPYIALYSNFPGGLAKIEMTEDHMPTILAELKPYDVITMDCVGGGVNDSLDIVYAYCRDITKAPSQNGVNTGPTIPNYQIIGAMP